jgi:hypothetical protein
MKDGLLSQETSPAVARLLFQEHPAWRFRCEGVDPRIKVLSLKEIERDRRLGIWTDLPYGLVAIFEGDTLSRHSLLRIR